MKKLKFYCDNCGWETMLKEDSIKGNEVCVFCEDELMLDDNGVDDVIANDLERAELEDMIHNISTYGNNEMWYKIERAIDNPYLRLRFRKNFFKAGGITPERENKMENRKQKLKTLAKLIGNVNIKEGRKYTKIDVRESGKYMVDSEGNIFGIKAYGVIDKGCQYGTLDTVNDWFWGDYIAYKKSNYEK